MSFVELAGDKARVKWSPIPGQAGDWRYWYCHDEREAHAFYGKLKQREEVVVAFVEVKGEENVWVLA